MVKVALLQCQKAPLFLVKSHRVGLFFRISKPFSLLDLFVFVSEIGIVRLFFLISCVGIYWFLPTKFAYKVLSAYTAKRFFYQNSLFWLVPKEKLALSKLLFLRFCRKNWLKSVRIIARKPCFRCHGHWSWREILYLFQLKIKSLCPDCKVSHVLFRASRMRTDEVWDNLLMQSFLAVDAVEDTLEFLEQFERRFAHVHENLVGSMLRCNFQSAAHMVADKFPGVLSCCLVDVFILAVMKKQVIAHTGADEALFHLWHGINGMIDVKQFAMVGVEVRAYLRMYA